MSTQPPDPDRRRTPPSPAEDPAMVRCRWCNRPIEPGQAVFTCFSSELCADSTIYMPFLPDRDPHSGSETVMCNSSDPRIAFWTFDSLLCISRFFDTLGLTGKPAPRQNRPGGITGYWWLVRCSVCGRMWTMMIDPAAPTEGHECPRCHKLAGNAVVMS